jgi:hypothetical protein
MFTSRRLHRLRNAILLSVTVLFSGAAAGCFGRFPAMTALYGFNKTASSNRVVQSLLLIGMVIIPVYEVGFLVDALVLNVVDFFGGSTVASKTQTLADGSTVEMTRVDGDTVRVRHVDAAGREDAFEIVRVGGNAGYVRGADGRMLGMVEQLPDGSLVRRAM